MINDKLYNFSGWIVRLYHNFSSNDKRANELICRLYCKYDHFDPCQVKNQFPVEGKVDSDKEDEKSKNDKKNKETNVNKYEDDYHKYANYFKNTMKGKKLQLYKIPLKQNNYDTVSDQEQEIDEDPGLVFDPSQGLMVELKETSTISTSSLSWREKNFIRRAKGKSYDKLLVGQMWRFLPMMDPLVNNFLVRDVDSAILNREVKAVEQWLHNSTALIHAMRDHPSHNGCILAGKDII